MRAGTEHRFFTGAMICAAVLAGAQPAAAFSIMGFHLWGEREDETRVEVIDPLTYTVTLTVSGQGEDLQSTLEEASSLFADKDEPASGTGGLLAKARGDYRRLIAALYSEGYYGPYVSIRIAGKEAADLSLGQDFPQDVPVTVDVATGPLFRFGDAAVVNPPPARGRDEDEETTHD